MRPITVAVGPLAAASANNISLSQTPAGAGALLLNGSTVTGGVAVLDVQRQIKITQAGDETGHSFVVSGTNNSGNAISETVAGSSGASVTTLLSYKTITSITISAAATGALTVGTTGVADSPWVRFDDWAPGPVTMQFTVAGTVSYTVQFSMDDPNSPTNAVLPAAMTWVDAVDTAIVTATATKTSTLAVAPLFARIHLNSETGTGNVTGTFLQSGAVPY